ncbi:MAG: penicillin-insensitive murein endopeptidase, partial [Elusimicrobia bacterium]|nr:penicillin-insensitive murein endopeptidase [Elusimicrobiota bacterium]
AAALRAAVLWGPVRALPPRWTMPTRAPAPPASREAPMRSVSLGLPWRGRLVNGVELPLDGPAWRSVRPWARRNFGTADLVDGIEWTARRLRAADALTPPLAFGDLSPEKGGRAARHASHQDGRDADLVFFWTTRDGTPVFSERMARFDSRGRARVDGRAVRFDAARNWKLVASLLKNPYFGRRVEWIFAYRPLRRLLLREAALVGADPALVARAARVMIQPRRFPHRDHMHVRIACSSADLRLGCRD